MSNIRLGDQVRFLNSRGEGVVTQLLEQNKVLVRDDTGFEFPLFTNEVVVVTKGSTIVPKVEAKYPNNIGGNFTPTDTKRERSYTAQTSPQEEKRNRANIKGEERINAYLAFLTEENGKLGESGYETYLINDSNYDLLIFYSSGKEGKRQVRFQGIIPFDSIERLEYFTPKELNDRSRINLCIIPCKIDEPYLHKQPYLLELRIEGSKFFKQNAFKENDFFEDGAILYPLIENDKLILQQKVNAEELATAMMQKNNPPASNQNRQQREQRGAIRQHTKNKSTPVVVDLHATELLDSLTGLNSGQILEYQLEKALEVMKAHRRTQDKGKKIIFIHGKGDGVLRQRLIDSIKKIFPKDLIQDAPFQEYGHGATLVTIQ